MTKATFQPQLLDGKTVLVDFDNAPWARTFHLNERNLVWHDDMKRRLYSKVASEEMSMSEEELEKYLEKNNIKFHEWTKVSLNKQCVDDQSKFIRLVTSYNTTDDEIYNLSEFGNGCSFIYI